MLIPLVLISAVLVAVILQIDTPPGSLVSGHAWVDSPPVADLVSLLRNLARPPPIALQLALPSLATLTAPARGLGVPQQALAAFAGALPFLPLAMVAGLAAWLLRLRHSRSNRIAVERGEPAANFSEFWSEPTQAPTLLLSPDIMPPAAQAQPPGADLAARARFVAMAFAFPEAPPRTHARDGSASWPLHMNCQPKRFALTLRHAALSYRLEFCNRGADVLGPLIIRADLVVAESRIALNREHGFANEPLPLCHYLDSLPSGDTIELTGELRLPLAGIAAMRLGAAELLVPLMRVCAESTGDAPAALTVSACFAVGLPPLVAGGGIQPFRLDTGPGIWRKLTARRLILADLS